ncbi:MAG: DinB family protein [Caldilinea sp. CFX5]|nr:DinB family protein [Caldilinea sp. CFX5]
MSGEIRTQIVNELLKSQQEITALLTTVADKQEWRPAPKQWSFRQIAWHLAITERECLLDRVQGIASGSNPTFGIYLDTDAEFMTRDLHFALEQWANARQAVIDFVNALPDAALAHTGYHPSFGRLTVLGYLQIFLDHDQRHLADLQAMVA